MRKLGTEAYPLTLRVSPKAPPSVRLHPARPYIGSPLGVSYEIKVFISEYQLAKSAKRKTFYCSFCTSHKAYLAGVWSHILAIIIELLLKVRTCVLKSFRAASRPVFSNNSAGLQLKTLLESQPNSSHRTHHPTCKTNKRKLRFLKAHTNTRL